MPTPTPEPPYGVACAVCGRPVWLPFRPRTPKVCDGCYAPRSPEEVDAADRERRFLAVAERVMREGK